MKSTPPKFADKFLEWFCREELLEDIQGDLYETFHFTLKKKGLFKARMQYIWLAFRSFRYSTIKKTKFNNNRFIGMTGNNFKIAFRVLLKNKVSSLINLFGLIIGMTCF